MTRRVSIAVTGLSLAALFLGALPAAAAPGQKAGTYATPTTSAVTLAPGFPNATVATSDPVLGVAGAAVLTGTTPFGQVYGTSAGRKYLVLHPTLTGPSLTTLQFESPTPASGWSFALGDVDADAVTLSGTATDGSFEFPGVMPIPVGLTVTEPGHAPGELFVVDPTDGAFGTSVTAPTGESLTAPVAPAEPATLPGTGASSAPLLPAVLLLGLGVLLLGSRRTAARIGRRG